MVLELGDLLNKWISVRDHSEACYIRSELPLFLEWDSSCKAVTNYSWDELVLLQVEK